MVLKFNDTYKQCFVLSKKCLLMKIGASIYYVLEVTLNVHIPGFYA